MFLIDFNDNYHGFVDLINCNLVFKVTIQKVVFQDVFVVFIVFNDFDVFNAFLIVDLYANYHLMLNYEEYIEDNVLIFAG